MLSLPDKEKRKHADQRKAERLRAEANRHLAAARLAHTIADELTGGQLSIFNKENYG